MRIKQSLEKEKHDYALCQSMMQLIKGQSHFLWALRDLSKTFETWRGICKFKLILSIFGTNKYADYIVRHDCKIVMLNYGQIFALMDNSGIKHTGSFICFVTPFLFNLYRVTWIIGFP